MSTIKSIEKKSSSKEITKYENTLPNPFAIHARPKETIVESEEIDIPFKDPKVGDKAKPI